MMKIERLGRHRRGATDEVCQRRAVAQAFGDASQHREPQPHDASKNFNLNS